MTPIISSQPNDLLLLQEIEVSVSVADPHDRKTLKCRHANCKLKNARPPDPDVRFCIKSRENGQREDIRHWAIGLFSPSGEETLHKR